VNTRAIIPALLLAGSCLAQDADRPLRLLIDRNLDRQLVELVSIDGEDIRFIDASGRAVTAPTTQFVALTPIDAWTDANAATSVFRRSGIVSRPGVLELTDGQRFVGTASVVSAGEESLAWNYARLGLLAVPLENIRRVVLPRIMTAEQAMPSLAVSDEDVLRLTNKDTLRGFIVSFGSEASIELADGSTIVTPMNVIDEMTLANPDESPEGVRVWLTGGNVVDVESLHAITGKADRIEATLEQGPIVAVNAASVPSEADDQPVGLRFEIDRNQIDAINFDTQALVPLASLQSNSPDRPLVIDDTGVSALDARSIQMPGPMRTTWTLPRGAARLAMTAELPLESRAWGNLDLIVLVDGVERERHTLSAQSPEAHIRLDLASARELTLELDEGQFGPVQDRVELREGILLIGR